MILGPQTRHYPLLLTVGLLVVTFVTVSEEQRTGIVENLGGASDRERPDSSDAKHTTPYFHGGEAGSTVWG